MSSPWASVVSFQDMAGLPVAAVGGKAATLARLAVAGFPVPPGLVVTSAAWARPAEQVAAEITLAMQTAELIGSGPFAVRSSAAAEDLADASYAGQYETFLNVPANQVVDAVFRCHDAAAAPRVALYQPRPNTGPGPGRGHAGDGGAGAADGAGGAAGVAFTAEPVDRRPQTRSW